MKETCLKRTRASSPLKQEVQPSVTMWKKKKKGGETQPISYQRKRISHCLESFKSDRKINFYM